MVFPEIEESVTLSPNRDVSARLYAGNEGGPPCFNPVILSGGYGWKLQILHAGLVRP